MEAFCHAAPLGAHLSTTGQEGNGSAQGDLLTDRELARKRETAKAWRNKYWSELPVTFAEGHSKGPGVYYGGATYPTKWEAERAALSLFARHEEWAAICGITHLGAFPVSE